MLDRVGEGLSGNLVDKELKLSRPFQIGIEVWNEENPGFIVKMSNKQCKRVYKPGMTNPRSAETKDDFAELLCRSLARSD